MAFSVLSENLRSEVQVSGYEVFFLKIFALRWNFLCKNFDSGCDVFFLEIFASSEQRFSERKPHTRRQLFSNCTSERRYSESSEKGASNWPCNRYGSWQERKVASFQASINLVPWCNLLSCQLEVTANKAIDLQATCISPESNPGHIDGGDVFYH